MRLACPVPDELPPLGPCCVCGGRENVVNIVMLPHRGAIPGRGWGCVVCNLPAEGAIAVLCNGCIGEPPKFACRGYPAHDGRIAIAELPQEVFAHDETQHALEEGVA